MADEPTIDEAIKHAAFVAEYYDGWVPETTAAIRTLLASHASLTADLAEAKRLMKPFAEEWRDHLEPHCASERDEALYHEYVALAAFVSNKGDG